MVRKYPARQIPHSVAPSRDEKPGPRTSQDAHDDEPGASVYVPASQASQEAWPVAPCAEPAGQTVQFEEPGLEAKNPDEHDWHTIVASVGVKSPTGQALQLVAPVST